MEIHHAIEQQVLKRYPGVASKAELHSLQNLRGIPDAIKNEVQDRLIREAWDEFYKRHPVVATQQELLDWATHIDRLYGPQFDPPVAAFRWRIRNKWDDIHMACPGEFESPQIRSRRLARPT
jgi:hypothetical protein